MCKFVTLMSSMIAAAYRFYRTKSQQESLKRRGKSEQRKILCRRYERIVRVGLDLADHMHA